MIGQWLLYLLFSVCFMRLLNVLKYVVIIELDGLLRISHSLTKKNQRTNGPVNAHLTSVSCFSIIFQI